MPNPNFMVIGTQKGGTSWLARMMRQHPDIYAPDKKELHFFNLKENYNLGMDTYRSFFDGHSVEKAIGEFTPNYLWICPNKKEIEELGVIPNIPELIHRQYPKLKFIVCLRNPVDRAVSAFYHFIRARSYPPYSRIHKIGHTNGIISMGLYRKHIEEWLKYFPIEQFHFVVYEEDIRKNKLATLQEVFRFLEVDDNFLPENLETKYNARKGHLYLYLNYYSPFAARIFFKMFNGLKPINFPKIRLKPEELEELSQFYAKENQGLDELINRRLPW